MIWLIVIVCAVGWLLALVMGVALAAAAKRGDRRGGMIDLTLSGNPTRDKGQSAA